MAIYRKRINGGKVWWVRVNYRRLNASRVCESQEAAKDAEAQPAARRGGPCSPVAEALEAVRAACRSSRPERPSPFLVFESARGSLRRSTQDVIP